MITRYALFESTINDGQTEAFRAAVLKELLPKWTVFPRALAVRVTFADERDAGSPEFPLILAIDYSDRDAVDAALNSPARTAGKDATEALLPAFSQAASTTTAHSHPL